MKHVDTTKVAIRARGLSLQYGRRYAFRDIDLTVGTGSVMALVGPSGCGKTSALHSFARLTDLVPHCVVTGDLCVAGSDVLSPGCDVVALRRHVGTIFQKPTPFPISIRRNIELPLREHGCSKNESQRVLEEVLRDVGLWEEVRDRLDSPAHRLSGGQQQRLCIARALALRPEILLMDEPCSALDPLSTAKIEQLVHRMRKNYTIVIVTHNIGQARRLADETAVFWVDDERVGMIVEVGPSDRIFTDPEHEVTRAYLAGQRG